jgi:hypothetical protein
MFRKLLIGMALLSSLFSVAQVNVTFRVNLTGNAINANGVHIAAGFQNWNPDSTALMDNGNGLFSATFSLAPGTYQFRFINGNDWPFGEIVPSTCGVADGFGGYNRQVIVAAGNDVILPAYCFSSCDPCVSQPGAVSLTLKVDMTNEVVSPDGMHIAGNFQNWMPGSNLMTYIGNNIYSYTLETLPDTEILYKFINGTDWTGAEIVPSTCGVSDGFGGYNRSVTTDGDDLNLSSVCFAECTSCDGSDPEMVQITIVVDMGNEPVDQNGVHIVGSFENWTIPGPIMSPIGNNQYQHIMEVTANSAFNYKFLNGQLMADAETVPAACDDDDGLGNLSRLLEVASSDSIVPVVCYNECAACENVVSDSVMVTFKVNMENETVSAQGVHIAGNFQNWNASSTEMTDANSDGIYEISVQVPANEQINFKFINGNDFGAVETPPNECVIGDGLGNLNRVLYTLDVDTEYGPVCFGECNDCGVIIEEPSNQIILMVNMAGQTVSPQGVHVAGNFQNWDPSATAMTDMGNGVWKYQYAADEWSNISFKFINGNNWGAAETVPSQCGLPDGNGGYNRILETGTIDVTYGPVCFAQCEICQPLSEDSVSVTFKVNMANETVSAQGVHIAGSFQNWLPNTTEMTDDNSDGVFEYTTQILAGSEVQFKFINGDAWTGEEIVPEDCNLDGTLNRAIQLASADYTFGPICFAACVDCDEIVEPTFVTVLFQVDMTNEVVSPQGIHIAGNFQGWNPNGTVLNEVGGGIWELSYQVEANTDIQFKFINGSNWTDSEVVPADCGLSDGFGAFNRTLSVGATNAVYGPICFGSCDACPVLLPVLVVFRVEMTNEVVSPDGVFVTGNFNDWDPLATQLSEYAPNMYEAVVVMTQGQVTQYKFLNGGVWTGAETVPDQCGVDDGTGIMNRTYTAGDTNETVPSICFSGCAPCVPMDFVQITFNVDMYLSNVDPSGIFVGGTFNNFNMTASELLPVGNGIYSASVQVLANTQTTYKFINGTTWEVVPFECGTNDGFGGYNRSITVDAADVNLPEVCFSSCAACVESVGEVVSPGFSLYPNPAQDYITISSNNLEKTSFEIYDTSGKLVLSNTKAGGKIFNIDLSALSSGMYQIVIPGLGAKTFIME